MRRGQRQVTTHVRTCDLWSDQINRLSQAGIFDIFLRSARLGRVRVHDEVAAPLGRAAS